MKYHFSSCIRALPLLQELKAENLLMSYAVDAARCHKTNGENVIIDSGAFSVWNKGAEIDIDDYLAFCLKQPEDWTFINLDVIPPKNSTKADIERCCEQGYENYLYLKKYLYNVMPVYHSGENIKWLKKFMEHTPYIGVGFGNDRHEKARRKFLMEVFRVVQLDYKIHGLGYSSVEGLAIFPFYSVDSISFKKSMINGTQYWNEDTKLWFYLRRRIKDFLRLENQITELWKQRGVQWQ